MTPDEFTNQELMLPVGHGHELYVFDWGNKTAKTPIIFLHGGPGGGVKDKYKNSFDPVAQRVIFFDQRGCGKSTPHGSLANNTTADLVEDIEKIADKLKLDKFIVTGGSWGSCLALAYALKYPERIKAMVLRGIFTGSQAEIDYIDQGHFAAYFPDVWDAYLDATPAKYRDDPSAYHTPRILGDDEQAMKESAYAYGNLEASVLSLDDRHTPPPLEDFDPTLARLEVHYMANRCFMPDRFIMDNTHKLKMPIYLIQGRYDMVCPPVTAYELNEKLPNSQLIWTVGGHSAGDRETWNVTRSVLLQLTQGNHG